MSTIGQKLSTYACHSINKRECGQNTIVTGSSRRRVVGAMSDISHAQAEGFIHGIALFPDLPGKNKGGKVW